MIYRLFTGRYIDLSKLISVSEVEHLEIAKRFDLTFQLQERPIVIYLSNHGRLPGRSDQKYDIEIEREKIIEDWKNLKTQNV